jgi:hypothetical protein
MSEIERLLTMRTNVLLFTAIAFGIWQLAWLSQDLFPDQQSLSFQIAGWTTVLGALLYAVAAFYLYRYSVAVKKAAACKVLNDELTQRNRAKTFMFGYVCLFGLIWVLIPLTEIVEIDLKISIRASATFGVVLPILYFVYLEKKSEGELE